MATVEMVIHWVESGSNSMSTYQALIGARDNPRDSLSIIQTGTNLIATVSNVAPILQPIRIITNGLSATSALTRIVVDWKDPGKKVQPEDVLTIVGSTGMIVVTLLVWAEIGPGAPAAINALVLSVDLQSAFQPYMNSAKTWLGNLLENTLQLSKPASTASSSLYWATMLDGSGWNLYSYDEIVSGRGLFAAMTDEGTSSPMLRISGSPVPGSFAPVNEDRYKSDYCRYLYDRSGGSDLVSWMHYCPTTNFR
jgi:hypothetical protein